MNIQEFEKIKDYNYLEYCDYLQGKYGIGLADYVNANWNKTRKVLRTSEGLITHHKREDTAPNLSNPDCYKKYPIEWQHKENLVYCDYLEHLYLHILASKYPNPEKEERAIIGISGALVFIIPELNDLFSGFVSNQKWQNTAFERVKDDKAVYLQMLKIYYEWLRTSKEFKAYTDNTPDPHELEALLKSRNAFPHSSNWRDSNNLEIYKEIIFAIFPQDKQLDALIGLFFEHTLKEKKGIAYKNKVLKDYHEKHPKVELRPLEVFLILTFIGEKYHTFFNHDGKFYAFSGFVYIDACTITETKTRKSENFDTIEEAKEKYPELDLEWFYNKREEAKANA